MKYNIGKQIKMNSYDELSGIQYGTINLDEMESPSGPIKLKEDVVNSLLKYLNYIGVNVQDHSYGLIVHLVCFVGNSEYKLEKTKLIRDRFYSKFPLTIDSFIIYREVDCDGTTILMSVD